MYEKVIHVFKIPQVAWAYVDRFLSAQEILAIEAMGCELYLPDALAELFAPIVADPAGFIAAAYARAVLEKAERDDGICYKAATFYRRLAYFSQYEPDRYAAIPGAVLKDWDAWYLNEYAQGAKPRLEVSLKDPTQLIENAFFYTLDETLRFIDGLDSDELLVVPCNCKTVALNCAGKKPNNVCIQFEKGINTEWDRGHGERINKERAKEIIREANKNGLMQTTEAGAAVCNCCGCCCYPIRASERIGARGLWPKKMYDLHWDAAACIHCGKCARVCNFGAFVKEGKTVSFDQEKCLSCTLCANHCPTGAISLSPVR